MYCQCTCHESLNHAASCGLWVQTHKHHGMLSLSAYVGAACLETGFLCNRSLLNNGANLHALQGLLPRTYCQCYSDLATITIADHVEL